MSSIQIESLQTVITLHQKLANRLAPAALTADNNAVSYPLIATALRIGCVALGVFFTVANTILIPLSLAQINCRFIVQTYLHDRIDSMEILKANLTVISLHLIAASAYFSCAISPSFTYSKIKVQQILTTGYLKQVIQGISSPHTFLSPDREIDPSVPWRSILLSQTATILEDINNDIRTLSPNHLAIALGVGARPQGLVATVLNNLPQLLLFTQATDPQQLQDDTRISMCSVFLEYMKLANKQLRDVEHMTLIRHHPQPGIAPHYQGDEISSHPEAGFYSVINWSLIYVAQAATIKDNKLFLNGPHHSSLEEIVWNSGGDSLFRDYKKLETLKDGIIHLKRHLEKLSESGYQSLMDKLSQKDIKEIPTTGTIDSKRECSRSELIAFGKDTPAEASLTDEQREQVIFLIIGDLRLKFMQSLMNNATFSNGVSWGEAFEVPES